MMRNEEDKYYFDYGREGDKAVLCIGERDANGDLMILAKFYSEQAKILDLLLEEMNNRCIELTAQVERTKRYVTRED